MVVRLHVGQNFLQTLFLSLSQGKRQAFFDSCHLFLRPIQNQTASLNSIFRLERLQLHLEIKEFLKLDTAKGLLVFCQILGKMHGTHSLTARHEFVFI